MINKIIIFLLVYFCSLGINAGDQSGGGVTGDIVPGYIPNLSGVGGSIGNGTRNPLIDIGDRPGRNPLILNAPLDYRDHIRTPVLSDLPRSSDLSDAIEQVDVFRIDSDLVREVTLKSGEVIKIEELHQHIRSEVVERLERLQQ